jgi:hypothetical protein
MKRQPSGPRPVYRLPNGHDTQSITAYRREWIKLGNAVAEALGCTLVLWCPDIYLQTPQGVAFQVPLCVAHKVVELAEEAEKAKPRWSYT